MKFPLAFGKLGVGELMLNKLGLKATRKPNMRPWKKLVEEVEKEKPTVKVALVGKYVELQDAYMSVREALKHAGLANGVEVEISWVHSADLEKDKGWDVVKKADASSSLAASVHAALKAKSLAARYARENKVPYLGLCLGNAGDVH
jgi:CTP synthase